MALKSVIIVWCLIIGVLLAVSQVECRRKRLLTIIVDSITKSSHEHVKYRYELQNSIYDFPHGYGKNLTVNGDYITDCHPFVESKLCNGTNGVCMNNGTILCVANPSNSRPCVGANCVVFKDKQCHSPSCEKTFSCLVRLRKLVRDSTNKKVFDPLPHQKGLCVTLVAKPVRIRKS
ncbi:hypothetical protein ILUMI_18403 [Ignelater luminosus]|uniref:Uncharacterized protein n=1 Tax=Ignelater luminosus TaxID=2038154 RepID=A0A8K0CI33_IGNLU|nr:hypothetical protein ILUMI_18403 [Ignelater luminosus]